MKLALVRQKYNPYGGAERFVERALAALALQNSQAAQASTTPDQKIHTTLITRQWQGPAEQNVLMCNPFYLGRLWRDRGFSYSVQAIVAEGRFDLVQSHERIPGCDIYRAGDGVHATWLALRGRGQSAFMRLATILHPWHRYTLAAESAMFRDLRLKAVICNSRMVRDDIANRFDVAESKLHVIYNGVDLQLFHPSLRETHRHNVRANLGIAEAAPFFLYVGSGFERKGVPQLLHAFALMKNKAAQLLIVGQDKKQKNMERLASTLGLVQRVQFVGGQNDVKPFYGAADAFVLPTLYDPFPNAALEALACGLPVITSTTCGVAEFIRNGKNGYVGNAHDEVQLAHHLDALSVPGASERMREHARSSVAHLGVERMAEQLITLYQTLITPPL